MPRGVYKRTEITRKRMSLSRIGKPNIRKGTKNTLEHNRKNSEANRGEKNHNWKGGISSENQKVRGLSEYKLWRISVFKRDWFTCVWCGFRSKSSKPTDIHADHIKPFALFPELRFAIDNGRTLCIPCHKTTFIYGRKLAPLK